MKSRRSRPWTKWPEISHLPGLLKTSNSGEKHSSKSLEMDLPNVWFRVERIFHIFFPSSSESSGAQKHKTGNSIGPPGTGGHKRLGRPPKKGTHLPVNSLGSLTSPRAVGGGSDKDRKRSPTSSPERDDEDSQAKRSKKKSNKR